MVSAAGLVRGGDMAPPADAKRPLTIRLRLRLFAEEAVLAPPGHAGKGPRPELRVVVAGRLGLVLERAPARGVARHELRQLGPRHALACLGSQHMPAVEL